MLRDEAVAQCLGRGARHRRSASSWQARRPGALVSPANGGGGYLLHRLLDGLARVTSTTGCGSAIQGASAGTVAPGICMPLADLEASERTDLRFQSAERGPAARAPPRMAALRGAGGPVSI